MALVASIYKSSADNHFPDILLLDEVDASLHPSMMRNMLSVINNVFIAQGVKVILVTHSPTTIALAQEESLYLMNPSGVNRVVKSNKQQALDILTEGYATLDQGIRLFDEVSRNQVTVISEGRNSEYLKRALHFRGISDVEVLTGIESLSGKNQLNTLFEFFVKVPHGNKVLFVWDCDAPHGRSESNNTFPFTLPRNTSNTISSKGIENMFPEALFDGFIKTISKANGTVTSQFDESTKTLFEAHVLSRNNPSDFASFEPFFQEIYRIKRL